MAAERGFERIKQRFEEVAEGFYEPGKRRREYRWVILQKDQLLERGGGL